MAKKRTQKAKPVKTYSKKVGRWRCECKGRTVYCAGAKKTYSTPAVACGVYKKINSIKAVESFVSRYGKKKTKTVVVGSKPKRRNPSLNTVTARGDHSIRLEGTQVIAYSRSGRKIANHYYPTEQSAERAYNIASKSEKAILRFVARYSVRNNPGVACGTPKKKAQTKRKNPSRCTTRRNVPKASKARPALRSILKRRGYI